MSIIIYNKQMQYIFNHPYTLDTENEVLKHEFTFRKH